jgi:nitrate reductase alpha subunit
VGIARSDWEIYKGIAKTFSEVAPEVLGVEKDLVLVPIQHDSPNEIAQPFDVADWKPGRGRTDSGKTMANVAWSSATIRTSTSASPRLAR